MGRQGVKGLAMAVNALEDITKLNAEAYLNWSYCDAPSCVPVAYSAASITRCQPVIIVSNEPNAVVPYGVPMTLTRYAQLIQDVRAKCSDAMLVIGNVSVEDWRSVGGQQRGADWLRELLPMIRDDHYVIGVHCYSITAWWCVNELREIDSLAVNVWVTEFGITSGDPREMKRLLIWLDKNTDAYFVFTNRQPSSCEKGKQGWELDNYVELVQCKTGDLTPLGIVFQGF